MLYGVIFSVYMESCFHFEQSGVCSLLRSLTHCYVVIALNISNLLYLKSSHYNESLLKVIYLYQQKPPYVVPCICLPINPVCHAFDCKISIIMSSLNVYQMNDELACNCGRLSYQRKGQGGNKPEHDLINLDILEEPESSGVMWT